MSLIPETKSSYLSRRFRNTLIDKSTAIRLLEDHRFGLSSIPFAAYNYLLSITEPSKTNKSRTAKEHDRNYGKAKRRELND